MQQRTLASMRCSPLAILVAALTAVAHGLMMRPAQPAGVVTVAMTAGANTDDVAWNIGRVNDSTSLQFQDLTPNTVSL
jgi:hypothetical protein